MEHSEVFLNYAPPLPLATYVEQLWCCEGYKPGHAKELRLPTGTVEMIINLRENALRVYDRENAERFQVFRGSLVCGPQSAHSILDTACQESAMGVVFKPGGALAVLRLPAHELCNARVALEDIWPAAYELREQLVLAETPQLRLRFLEAALIRHLRPHVRHPAVGIALDAFQSAGQMATVGEVSGRTGFSQRRFIQVFRDEVGLSPKLYCRLLRFQEVLSQIEAKQNLDWAGVAVSCGYFDQAHLIRDFQAFSGLSPTAYLRQRGEHRNHVPLAD